MSGELIPLSHCLTAKRPVTSPIAYHAGHFYHAGQFYGAVRHWVKRLKSQSDQRYALFTEDAYPLAVMLFALFHAGKEVWIPGNNRPGTALQLQQLECQLIGDWDAARTFDYCLESTTCSGLPLLPLDPSETKLTMFTSGSTGQSKPVTKRLIQFQLEIEALERQWGKQLGHAAALATVSHQHIYGLLFRVLWPLSTGRCFHSSCYINPETLVKGAQDATAYWIASPAHLKRLDFGSPWEGIASLCAVFSSGGALQHEVAQQVLASSGQPVIEIYGSTESGGIGWRVQGNDPLTPWTLFEGMVLTQTDDGWELHSPYLQIPPCPPFSKGGVTPLPLFSSRGGITPAFFTLPPFGKGGQGGFKLDDQISLQDDGRFILHGRLDRIVKIEEKRLSLTEMEQRLMAMPGVAEAFTLMLTNHRDVVGAVVVLTEDGFRSLKNLGRKPLIKQLRNALYQYFDAVVLPRKWLFLERMLLTSEGKIDQPVLRQLLDMDSRKFPYVLDVEKTVHTVELKLNIPEKLLYFPDHFSSYPILPGVVQIAWAEHFGKLFFAIDEPFLCMEVIKFVKVIQPGAELKLNLNWKASAGKLYFNFSSESGAHGSGRIVYGQQG
jgi:acyl-CoA synthetase (AMP-forming)/AMP-acid ligase II/3-hydroxymyristoyl/3-hydroxydecanoyl-(acyl carrier protein) dehydratase